MEIIKKIDDIDNQIRKLTDKRKSILKKEMGKFKGKYFKNKEEKVVKILIFFVSTDYWDNAINYIRSFYCNDKYSSWFKIDEEQGFDYELYDLYKLKKAIEITKEEYDELRNMIIGHSKTDEIEKVENKYALLNEQEENGESKI